MNIGLVLSGGMAKGAYQIGALKAIAEYIDYREVKYISCASIGVLNGYAFATGKLNKAERIWKNLCCHDNKLLINKILRSNALQQNIHEIYSERDRLFGEFYISLLELYSKSIIYQNLSAVDSPLIPLYLKASIAMPIYNDSVAVSGYQYFDGAMVDNIPVYPLLQHQLDYIICIYFDDSSYTFENTGFDGKVIKITFPSKSIVQQSVVFQRDSINQMIQDGYEITRNLLQVIFINGAGDLASIYDRISFINKQYSERHLRITGDMVVSNLNRVLQKLTRKQIV